jgi:alkanesulfonate monooxygenase
MTTEFFWHLPADGDGRAIRNEQWTRGDYTPAITQRPVFARTDVRRDGYTWFDHLTQIARAAELTGFDGALIPQTPAGEEPWIVAGALAREVRKLTFLPSLPAPFLSAVYAAKMANSFQRLTGGRLAWNLVTEEHRPGVWHGRNWSIAEQIKRTGEFLDVVKGFWNNAPFTYRGNYYEVENGGFAPALSGQPLPRIFLSGTSDDALALSARHADVHVFALDAIEVISGYIATLDALAAAQGRKLQYAIQTDVVARHTSDDAWNDLRRRWHQAGSKAVPISATQEIPAHSDADFDALIRDANLWAGFGQVRSGAPVGLVGSFEEIATRIADYAAAGISLFALAANPHLEEAYRVGEQLLPLAKAKIAQRIFKDRHGTERNL